MPEAAKADSGADKSNSIKRLTAEVAERAEKTFL
jgi:hypothetical protein